MSALSPTPSSDDDWSSDCSSAAGPDAAAPRETDAARDLLVFAADKAGMQVQIGTIGTIGTAYQFVPRLLSQPLLAQRLHVTRIAQDVDRGRVNRIINAASCGSACG
jgi:hypothetical protein